MSDQIPSCPVWGITGPIGSGKSTLGKIIESFGGVNIEVDAIGHRFLKEPAVKNELGRVFGKGIFRPDGTIDPRELGRKAFAAPDSLGNLNGIMHPPMVAEVRRIVDRERSSGVLVVVINAALLQIMKLDSLCDLVIFIRARKDIRLDRIVNYRGMSPDRAKARLDAQDPEPEAREGIIFHDNDQTVDELRTWAEATLLPMLKSQSTLKGVPMPSSSNPFTPAWMERVHSACDLENPELEKVLQEVAGLSEIPHCLFPRIVESQILVPSPGSPVPAGGPGLDKDEAVAFSSRTSLKELFPEGTPHLDINLGEFIRALPSSGPALVLHLPARQMIRFDSRSLEKMRSIAPRKCPPEEGSGFTDVEISEGAEMIISPPDPEPDPAFVLGIQEILGSSPATSGLFLFETMFKTGESSLVIGVVPVPGADRNALSSLFERAMGLEAAKKEERRIDFMVIEDPSLLEVISTTGIQVI